MASCLTTGTAIPKVLCGQFARQPSSSTLGQGSRLTTLTKQPRADHVLGSSADLRHRVQQVSCKAEPSGRGAPSSTKISVPQSKEESVQQACEALNTRLDDSKGKGKPTKGFKLSNVKRLIVEIPDADDSPKSVVSLAEDLLNGLAPELASSVTLVFGDVEAALLASTKVQNQVVALDDVPDEPLVGPLLIVEPSAQQLGEAEELLKRWRGRVVILLNPEWAEGQSVPSSHTAFMKSFEVVYCFQPIAIQAFIVTTTQGAVSKRVVKGQSGQMPWQIMKQGWGNNWKVIGQMQRRPTSQDLELAFLNASAAESPITAGIKAVKQLAPSKKK